MPVNLSQFARPNTVSIFASDPATLGKVVALILQDVAFPVPGRVRLDLTRQYQGSKRYTPQRNPIERVVVSGIKRDPEIVLVQGSLSANPIGPLSTGLGGFGSIIRRDLAELAKLERIAERGEPVVLVTPRKVYPSMSISIDDTHTGTHKVELALTFEEVRIVAPYTVVGSVDLDTMLAGVGVEQNLGAQPTALVDAPAGVAGGLG